jgi:hypothetical protein
MSQTPGQAHVHVHAHAHAHAQALILLALAGPALAADGPSPAAPPARMGAAPFDFDKAPSAAPAVTEQGPDHVQCVPPGPSEPRNGS